MCELLDVAYFACRGYVSQSEQYKAAKRQAGYIRGGQDVIVLHLGDHDPSGIDMTRDNQQRINMLSWRAGVLVRRIALNLEQVEKYGPPPNPAKLTDSRAGEYTAVYGYDSWELDALEPSVIEELIESEVLELRDEDKHNEVLDRENEHKALLRAAADNWPATANFLRSLKD